MFLGLGGRGVKVGKQRWGSVVERVLHNSMLVINNTFVTEGWPQEA